jgi:DNA polymerase III epsilon subunit-like protein
MLYTVLDIETNGLSSSSCEILEVGYIQVDRSVNIIRHGVIYFYKPEWEIENKSQMYHKLSRSFLESKCPDNETFKENLTKLYTLFFRGVIIGKNSDRFDIPAIKAFLRRNIDCLDDVPTWGTLDLQVYYTDFFRKWYSEKYGVSAGRKTGTLEELIEMIGYTQDDVRKGFRQDLNESNRSDAHGALYDTYMTYLLTKYAVENYGMKL